jgi:hypothetical protein
MMTTIHAQGGPDIALTPHTTTTGSGSRLPGLDELGLV